MRAMQRYGSGVLLIVVGVAFLVVLGMAPAERASAHAGEAGAGRELCRVVRAIGAAVDLQVE